MERYEVSFKWEKSPDDWGARVQSIKSVVGCVKVLREYPGRFEFKPEICAGLVEYETVGPNNERIRFSFTKPGERRSKAALKKLSEALGWHVWHIQPTRDYLAIAPTVWQDLVRPQFWPGYALWIWRRPPLMFVEAGVGSVGQLTAIAGPIPIVRGYLKLRGTLIEAERRAKRAVALPTRKIKLAEPGALLVAAKITKRRFREVSAHRDPAFFAAKRQFNKGTVLCVVYRGLDEDDRTTCQITTWLPVKGGAGIELKSSHRVAAATATGDLVPILRELFEKAGSK